MTDPTFERLAREIRYLAPACTWAARFSNRATWCPRLVRDVPLRLVALAIRAHVSLRA
jgi:hypothetical protein